MVGNEKMLPTLLLLRAAGATRYTFPRWERGNEKKNGAWDALYGLRATLATGLNTHFEFLHGNHIHFRKRQLL